MQDPLVVGPGGYALLVLSIHDMSGASIPLLLTDVDGLLTQRGRSIEGLSCCWIVHRLVNTLLLSLYLDVII